MYDGPGRLSLLMSVNYLNNVVVKVNVKFQSHCTLNWMLIPFVSSSLSETNAGATHHAGRISLTPGKSSSDSPPQRIIINK